MNMHHLIVYVLFAFTFTWAFHIQIVRKNLSIKQGPGRLLYRLGLPGPTLAAIFVSFASGSLEWLAQRVFHWSVDIIWWFLAVFTIPTIYFISVCIYSKSIFKPNFIYHHPEQGWFVLILSQLYVVFSEEVGWRAFALPLLMKLFGSLGGTLALGSIWALWHLPMFWVPSSHQKGAFWNYLYSMIAWSVIMTILVNGSGGSVILAMVFHAVANISYFTMDIPPEAERYINVILGIVSILLILLMPEPLITYNP